MDRRVWWATVHGVAKELDTTEQPNNNNINNAQLNLFESFITFQFSSVQSFSRVRLFATL